MPPDLPSQSPDNAGYAALLTRFRQQQTRGSADDTPESASPKERDLPALSDTGAGEILTAAEKETAQHLRNVWLSFIRWRKPADKEGKNPAYEHWRNACRQRHFSPLMCIDTVGHRFSIDDVDARYKMRRGTARTNMRNCLALFQNQGTAGVAASP